MFSVWKVIKLISFSWVLQTHSSLSESPHVCTAVMPSIPSKMLLSVKVQAQGGPPRGVLEWPYTAAWKLIIHLHSRLYIQGLQIGSWRLAIMGGFHSGHCGKVKRNQGFPALLANHPPTSPPAPESRIVNISTLMDPSTQASGTGVSFALTGSLLG